MRFDDPDGIGRVLWSVFNGAPSEASAIGGIFEFAATDQLLAWGHARSNSPPHMYVAGPRGENLRDLNIPFHRPPYHMHADGDRVVFASADDIWLYTGSSGSLENLTNDAAGQWSPWIHGDHVVWIDQRDNPGHGLENWDNPEVYYMNLRDRIPVRITHDPAERPALQGDVTTDGEWVVWSDDRNAPRPNTDDFRNSAEIYGYHLPTRREVAIVASREHHMTTARIIEGEVYFVCQPRPTGDGGLPPLGLYRIALPAPE